MVLTSKWGRIQSEIQIWADQLVASWTLVRSPWKWAKMLSELRSPTGPSSPAVHWANPHWCWQVEGVVRPPHRDIFRGAARHHAEQDSAGEARQPGVGAASLYPCCRPTASSTPARTISTSGPRGWARCPARAPWWGPPSPASWAGPSTTSNTETGQSQTVV